MDEHSKEVYLSRCEGDQSQVKKGNQMMQWLTKTMNRVGADKKVIWKASSMHHPMFGLHYLDYEAIINDFLPRMEANGYDVFLNGHEHLMNYARVETGVDYKQYSTTLKYQS